MSEIQIRQLLSESGNWLTELRTSGWLQTDNAIAAPAADPSTTLFDGEDPPLVVGLFGGTGVGKSSLLNRLAGSDVARTGVVRPTSMKITAYMHESVSIDQLPSGFAVEKVTERKHQHNDVKNIVWVDMPDFDSEETSNRDQVLLWLPYIDVLLYVVTPERYRDAKGWQLLRRDGYRHAWLFIVNQWDRAENSQLDDFRGLLKGAGFAEPMVFRTDCSDSPVRVDDDFEDLTSVVSGLAERKLVQQLQQRGWLQRLAELKARLARAADELSPATPEAERITDGWQHHWSVFCRKTTESMQVPLADYAQRFQQPKRGLRQIFASLFVNTSEEQMRAKQIALQNPAHELWDQWVQQRQADTVDDYQADHARHGVNPVKMTQVLGEIDESTNAKIAQGLDQELAALIASPGRPWQRLLVQICGWLKMLLPLAVIVWSGVRIFQGFYFGVSDRSALLGLDFLTNALMLTGFAFFVPWIVAAVLRPSIAASIPVCLGDSVAAVLADTDVEVQGRLQVLAQERLQLIESVTSRADAVDEELDRARVLQDPRLTALVAGFAGDKPPT